MEIPVDTRSSLRDFLNVLFKHKVQILLFFFATACTVAIGTFMMKPTYKATSQILVKIGRENLYVPTVSSNRNNPIINTNREEQVNSAIQILKSTSLAKAVVKALGATAIYKDLKSEKRAGLVSLLPNARARLSPADMAVLRLQKNLELDAVKKSNVIEVSYKNKDPNMAATVINTLVNLYLDHHLHVYKNPESYSFFEQQSRLLKDKLAVAEEGLQRFKTENNLSSFDEELSILLKEQGRLRDSLNQTRSRRAKTGSRIGELRLQMAGTPRTIPLGEEVNHNPYVVSALQTRLVELKLKEKQLSSKYTERNRLVQDVKDEISMVSGRLEEQGKKQYGKSNSGVNTIYQRLEEQLFGNQAQLKAIMAEEKTQSAQLAGYQDRLDKINGVKVKLNRLEQEVEVDRQNYRLYLTKFEESRITNAMDSDKITNVSIIEPASAPLKPVSPKVLLNLVLGIFLGAFGGLGLAFFKEYLDDSLEKPEQAETAIGIPVLASVPEFKT